MEASDKKTKTPYTPVKALTPRNKMIFNNSLRSIKVFKVKFTRDLIKAAKNWD